MLSALQTEYASGAVDLKNGIDMVLKDFDGKVSRQQIILYLGDGESAVDPLSETFTIAWTSDNMPQTITNAATGKYREFAYNTNGQLTDKWDELRDHTTIAYQNLPVDTNDIATNWEVGRAIGDAHP